MSLKPSGIVALDVAHDRSAFDCGREPLNRYLRQQATQDIRRRVAACFVMLDADQCVMGYYTLATAGVALTDLPPETARKLPRYPTVPAIRLGRLAIDRRCKGLGLGGALLYDALRRAVRSEIAAFAMVVDAKDVRAAAFYEHHGFTPLDGPPRCLLLPLATVG